MTADQEKPKRSRVKTVAVRLTSFLLMAALVIGAVALIVYRDTLNLDALRRKITYWGLERSALGETDGFDYDGDPSNAFAAYNGGLLVASGTGVRFFGRLGTRYVDETAALTNPAISASGKLAIAYDVGGGTLLGLTGNDITFRLTLPEGGGIFSARANGAGWCAVTTTESGYKGAATVYNAKHEKVFAFDSAERFITDAVVTGDNSTLAAVTIGQTGGAFESCLVRYRLADGKKLEETSLGDRVVLQLGTLGDTFCAVCETETVFYTPGGALSVYGYNRENFRGFSLGGDGFVALATSRYKAGSLGRLVTVDASGEALGEVQLTEELLDVSAAGRYVAALFADRLDVYTRDLALYSQLQGTENARSALMRPDGTVVLIGAQSARIYVP
jgi:hypothetical protein